MRAAWLLNRFSWTFALQPVDCVTSVVHADPFIGATFVIPRELGFRWWAVLEANPAFVTARYDQHAECCALGKELSYAAPGSHS